MTAALLALNSRTFASLRHHRNYRLFFTGQLVSVIGTWMQDTALPWLILSLTHSPVYVGALVFARFAPFMIFGLFSGVLADRFDNRRVVMITQASSMVVAAALAVLAFAGVDVIWPYFVLAFCGGAALVFDAPNRHALTFRLVGRDELPNAIALNSSLFNAGRVIGPALGGILIAAVGVGWCFAFNALSFLAVLAALAMMRASELYPVERSERGERRDPRGARVRLAHACRARRDRDHGRRRRARVQLPGAAAGARLGDAACGRRRVRRAVRELRRRRARRRADRPRPRGSASWRALFVGSAGFNGALILLAPVGNAAIAAALLFCVGLCFSVWTSNSQSILQLTSPDALRGRVLGLYLFVFAGLAPIGGLLAGVLADIGGTELALAVAGGGGSSRRCGRRRACAA